MIRIKRDSGYADLFRAYKVMLDGKQVARVQNGQTVTVDVPPGVHRLYLKLDWCRSNKVDFEAGDREILFECGSPMRGWRMLLGALYATVWCRRYIWLRREMSLDGFSGPPGPGLTAKPLI